MTSLWRHNVSTVSKIEKWLFCVFNIENIDFYIQNHKKCGFHGFFAKNMLENDDSNLQTKFGVHHFKYFQNNQILKSRDRIEPPHLPTLKAYPTPGKGGRFDFFFR